MNRVTKRTVISAVALLLSGGLQLSMAHAAPELRCRAETRGSTRSRISVDGKNLAAGNYTAKVTSNNGANTQTSPAQATVGDEVEFDFDSNANDIAAGATSIPANFISGTTTAQIINASNVVILSGNCPVRVR